VYKWRKLRAGIGSTYSIQHAKLDISNTIFTIPFYASMILMYSSKQTQHELMGLFAMKGQIKFEIACRPVLDCSYFEIDFVKPGRINLLLLMFLAFELI
jgi:hypothetical protein